jgi:hypothetical protein
MAVKQAVKQEFRGGSYVLADTRAWRVARAAVDSAVYSPSEHRTLVVLLRPTL